MSPEERAYYFQLIADALLACGIEVGGCSGRALCSSCPSETLTAEGGVDGWRVYYRLQIAPLAEVMGVDCAFERSKPLVHEALPFASYLFGELVNRALAQGWVGPHGRKASVRVREFGPMISVHSRVRIPPVSPPHRLLRRRFDDEVFPVLGAVHRCVAYYSSHPRFDEVHGAEFLQELLDPNLGRTQ